jgi:hypothetical protein
MSQQAFSFEPNDWRVCETLRAPLSGSMATTTTPVKYAKDLTKEPPRSPRLRIGGYVLLARMADKGRAALNGTVGEYHFNCPVDNLLFSFKGLKGEDVQQVLASGKSDDDVAAWITSNGTRKSPEEIKAWSDATEAVNYYHVPEKREWFAEECKRLGLDPARTTLFDYLEEDDRVSFRK